MYVYGIRCAPCDLSGLPENAQADYYMDYGLLVFPTYTRASCIRSYGKRLGTGFWTQARLMLQYPMKSHCAAYLEHPWLAREETSVVAALREFYPGLEANWYYVPRTVTASELAEAEEDEDEE